MWADVTVSVREQTDIAFARRESLELARLSRLDQNDVGAVAIVVTEAASNLIKHAGGGDIVARALECGSVEIITIDRGKGMADPARCLEDGFSTAGSPGTGLGAIARLSVFHQIYSTPGQGTIVLARVGKGSCAASPLEMSAISLPFPGEQVCGDAWAFRESGGRYRLTVADGLGHGPQASEAARAAVEMAANANGSQAVALMEAMHNKLRATRGAAVAIADIVFPASDPTSREVAFTSVGNVSGSIVAPPDVNPAARRQMISMNGTVGHEMRKARTFTYPVSAGSLVILHSDGIATHWSLDKYPGLANCDTSVIAAVLIRDFRRNRDDATVVVVRAAESTP